MLDRLARKAIDPVVNHLGRALAARGWSADGVTLLGLCLGLTSAALLAVGAPGWLALLPLLAGRVADGLDGAVARATQKTDFGGYWDIVADFSFYAAVPLAMVLRDPGANGVAGAFVLATFYINGASFLGYAVLAEKAGIETRAQGEKSLYYATGLLEGSETIAFFTAICLWPGYFSAMAWGFGALCLLTATQRVLAARRVFGAGHARP